MDLDILKKTIIKDIEECDCIESLGRVMMNDSKIVTSAISEYWGTNRRMKVCNCKYLVGFDGTCETPKNYVPTKVIVRSICFWCGGSNLI